MKIVVGLLAAGALLVGAPAAYAGPKGTPNYYGYVPHQKTGGNHPGGHSSVTGHKKNGSGSPYYSYGGYSGGSGSKGSTGSKSYDGHDGYDGHDKGKSKYKKPATCFPPGHCKSINQGYYGPPGQRGR